MLGRLYICGGMGVARLIELAYSRRNLSAVAETKEGSASRATYPFIVLIHSIVIGGTAMWGRHPHFGWLMVLFAVQPLRAWVLLTLRHRWNARGSVAADLDVAKNGPYAYVRHPNYTVVMIELLSLPMAFGLNRLAVGASLINALLLALRIRDEERLLGELPGYTEHFRDKARFVPAIKSRGRSS